MILQVCDHLAQGLHFLGLENQSAFTGVPRKNTHTHRFALRCQNSSIERNDGFKGLTSGSQPFFRRRHTFGQRKNWRHF
jgi:hypothetical protein